MGTFKNILTGIKMRTSFLKKIIIIPLSSFVHQYNQERMKVPSYSLGITERSNISQKFKLSRPSAPSKEFVSDLSYIYLFSTYLFGNTVIFFSSEN